MKKVFDEYIYSPSDLISFLESDYITWMDRFYMDFPELVIPDKESEEARLFFEKGNEHEKTYFQQLMNQGMDVFDAANAEDRLKGTLEAIHAGREVIYQAELTKSPFKGYADFIFRVNEPSSLGNFSYEIGDTKLSRKAKPYHILQLCCYAEMLEEIQGTRPKNLRIILGNGEMRSFKTDDYYYYYLKVKESFLNQQENFDPENRPEPIYGQSFGRWASYAEDYLEKTDHLSRVANITQSQIKKLENAGIRTLTALATTQLSHVPKLEPQIFSRLRHQASLQYKSKGLEKPLFEVIPRPKDTNIPRFGLELLPPASANDVFFDMEGYPLVDGGLEYLFGATYLKSGTPCFIDWWAHNAQEEKAAFEGFIDWIYARWTEDPTMHIYHYASYEVTAMRKLMGRYGTREKEVDDLLRHEVFVDLYKVVKQSIRVGEPAYSIKNIEHLYREAREGDVQTAGASVVFYEKWLDTQDGPDWQTSKILNDIREYNRVDCDSTWQLAEWLWSVQQENNIEWVPPLKNSATETPDETNKPAPQTAGALAQEILAEIPEDRSDNPEHWRIQELLAFFLEFHRREKKPVWWAFYERQTKSDEELMDDPECIAWLVRTNTPAEEVKKSKVFEYSYNPDQETKRKVGDKCYFLMDLEEVRNITIESLDGNRGIISLKVSSQTLSKIGGELPQQINLMPASDNIPNTVADGIYRVVSNWKETGTLPQALSDFLYRRPPQLMAPVTGSLIPETTPQREFPQAVLSIVENLDNSVLCIQGPPGAGKSYTASHVILNLILKGYRIGVTSNSHKAINNLMEKVAALAEKEGKDIYGVKIFSKEEDQIQGFNSIQNIKSIKNLAAFPQDQIQFIGGTAWAFSSEHAENLLDYLFIDEAGQVSIANLVGMSQSTRNIILLGDQMQLGQPIQGSHPGESGQSILEYYLQGESTIPPEKGVFLATTYRLHPEICEFISQAVYEGRLQSNETETRKQILTLPISLSEEASLKEAGILYLPVPHEGNAQSSQEEVEVIKSLFDALLRCKTTNGKGEIHLMTKNDILVVAPYNMQVRLLQDALGPEARVGSVDKFQGQEAPVVIVSMCASSGQESSRGLDFLLCKNRINVAVSRAQNLAIVVGSPSISLTRCKSLDEVALVNLFCWVTEEYGWEAPKKPMADSI